MIKTDFTSCRAYIATVNRQGMIYPPKLQYAIAVIVIPVDRLRIRSPTPFTHNTEGRGKSLAVVHIILALIK